MYNSVVIPSTTAGNVQGCYYYAQSYDGNNAVHGSPMGHNQQPNGGGVDRSVIPSMSLFFCHFLLIILFPNFREFYDDKKDISGFVDFFRIIC